VNRQCRFEAVVEIFVYEKSEGWVKNLITLRLSVGVQRTRECRL